MRHMKYKGKKGKYNWEKIWELDSKTERKFKHKTHRDLEDRYLNLS